MISQFEQDFFHLESGRKGLNENSSTNGVVGHADVGLGEQEDIVPETCFEVVFHLREIEIWTSATLNELLGIVIKVKCEIEDGTRNWCIVYGKARFVEVPSTWTR